MVEENLDQSAWLTTVLLCLFLGMLGIHRFYTGHKEIGVGQLLITIFTFTLLGWIWPLIDLIMLLSGSYKDCDGHVLRLR